MRRLKMLWHIIQVTGFTRFALSFVTFVFGSGGVLFLVEPAITNYGDGLWYAFVTSTTVGYGDLLAVTLIGSLCKNHVGGAVHYSSPPRHNQTWSTLLRSVD